MSEEKEKITANTEPDTSQPEPKQKEYVYDKQEKSFFLTLNNPQIYGYDHDKIIDIVHAKFKNVIYWCMCDEQGTTYHSHVYILLSKKKDGVRFVTLFHMLT